MDYITQTYPNYYPDIWQYPYGGCIGGDITNHPIGIHGDLYTGWWWLEPWNFMTFQKQLGMSSSQLTFTPSFFRGVGSTTNQIIINIQPYQPILTIEHHWTIYGTMVYSTDHQTIHHQISWWNGLKWQNFISILHPLFFPPGSWD